MIEKRSVLLLKSQDASDSPDKYEELLKSHGFNVKQVKTLIFHFSKYTDALRKIVTEDVSAYEGIIFSSPRAVQAVHLAVESKEKMKLWNDKHNFAVGEETFKQALDKLGLTCYGKDAGNATNLSNVILKDKTNYVKPFLFPHGNLKTDTLNLLLEKEGVQIKGVLVYETDSNTEILQEISNVTNNFTTVPEYMVFFSPSGFHSAIEHLKKIPDLNRVQFIAIGPVTEVALKESNYKVFGVAKKPTPKDVLDLLLKNPNCGL